MFERRTLTILIIGLCLVGCSRQPPAQSASVSTPPTSTPKAATSSVELETVAALPRAENGPSTPAPAPNAVEPAPVSAAPTSSAAPLSDQAIRATIIQDSLASYYGSCPCPYNTDRGGRRCGGRSAYSRPGGAAPLCYDSDVSDAMVSAYRAKLNRS